MKKTPEDIADEKMESCLPCAYPKDLYPYGLCLSLCEEELEKLDLDDSADVGDNIYMSCIARVTSVNKRETDQGAKVRVELQITDIQVDGAEDTEEDLVPRKINYKALYKE